MSLQVIFGVREKRDTTFRLTRNTAGGYSLTVDNDYGTVSIQCTEDQLYLLVAPLNEEIARLEQAEAHTREHPGASPEEDNRHEDGGQYTR